MLPEPFIIVGTYLAAASSFVPFEQYEETAAQLTNSQQEDYFLVHQARYLTHFALDTISSIEKDLATLRNELSYTNTLLDNSLHHLNQQIVGPPFGSQHLFVNQVQVSEATSSEAGDSEQVGQPSDYPSEPSSASESSATSSYTHSSAAVAPVIDFGSQVTEEEPLVFDPYSWGPTYSPITSQTYKFD